MNSWIQRIALLLVALCTAAQCALTTEECASLLREAERCFDDGNEVAATSHERAVENWRKAVTRYEKVIKEGNVANGALFYNLGNAYFRLGEMPSPTTGAPKCSFPGMRMCAATWHTPGGTARTASRSPRRRR